MREEFVVLVSLFIGIGGFPVAPDINVKNSDELSKREKSEATKNLEVKDLNETELYHEGIDDKINISERASVYINQKFRKQFRNHMYKVLVPRVEYYQNFVEDNVSFMNAVKGGAVTTQKPKNKLFVPNIPNIAHQKYPHRQYNYPNEPMYNPPQQQQNQPKNVKMYTDRNNIPLLPLVTKKPINSESKPENLQKEPKQDRIPNKIPQEHQEMNRPYSTIASINSNPGNELKAVSKNKGRITALTNRKSNNIKCSFPDPHLLHRSSFHNRPPAVMKKVMNRNNMNQINYIRSNYENDNNKQWRNSFSDINLENISGLSEEDDNKIDKYIKEALEDKEKNDDINAYIKMMRNSQHNDKLSNNIKGQIIIDNHI